MQFSCNNVFLDAALKVGDQGMRETAEKFGFNEDVYSDAFGDMLATKSLYPDKLDKPGTALTGMGQEASRAPRCRWRWSPRPSPTTAS